MEKNRRQFLEFMGLGTIGVSAVISSPKVSQTVLAGPKRDLTFNPIEPSSADKFVLADHFNYYPIASWKDPLNDKGDRFGFNNDYIGILPFKGKDDEAIMFVNHEFPHPLMVAGFDGKGEKSKEQVLEEQKALGLTIMKIKRSSEGKWTLVKNDPINRRIDGTTAIPFANSVEVAGSKTAIGTFANCSGGITPWGSVLSCEENYQDYYGDVTHDSEGKVSWNKESKFGWINHFNRRPEHYGWIVEADPLSGAAKKLTSLGRFAHEGATVTTTKDGRIVVYSGDDAKAQCFYKFISDSSTSLEKGTLYVANIGLGRWIPLDIEKTPILKKHFKTQLDVLIHTRKAAKIVGGSPLDRPEGCAINPLTKGVFLSLTNNTSRGNYFGYIAKFEEDNADHGSLTFKYGAYVAGGPKTGLACPDNIAFDRRGNLWITTDISDSKIGKGVYKSFKNNGLFFVPMSGKDAGKVFQVASGPVQSELTGPAFSEDGKTLFLSIQHPGGKTKDLTKPTSHFAALKDGIPRPTVVAVRGPILEKMISSH